MDTQTFSTFFALLAVLCNIAALGAAGVWIGARFSPAARELRDRMRESALSVLLLAWLIATVSTLGSLYYSEVANFQPCTLCWYQRIGMYPLVALLGLGALRREPTVRFYAYPLLAGGGVVSVYHYLIQRFPSLESGSCKIGVPCSLQWVEKFGFITIPYMAMSGFLAISLLLLLSAPGRGGLRRSARTAVVESP